MERDRRNFVKLMAAAGGAIAVPPWLGGCAPPRPQVRPRLVLLYATCSLNADYLSPYGGAADLTPALARFAADGAVLEAHQTESGQSGIAFASIFSGVHADRHGIFDHPSALSPSLPLITAAYAEAGYDVFFWGGHGMASYDLGYGRGAPPENHHQQPLTADNFSFGAILERLSADPSYRVFIITNFTATHMKYTKNPRLFSEAERSPNTLPEHFQQLGLGEQEFYRYRELLFNGVTAFSICGRFEETVQRWQLSPAETGAFCATMDYLYRCAVHRLDTLFGAVVERIEAAGLLDASLVAFTADHGETLYRDNTFFKFAHGYQLAPEVLRVPMIIRAPALGVEPRRHHFVSRSIDVFPTLAGLSGITGTPSRPLEGVALTAALTGAATAPELAAFSHTALVHTNIVNDPEYRDSTLHQLFPKRDPGLMWVSVRQGSMVFKWTRPDSDQGFVASAFDPGSDPEERHDLFDPANPLHGRALASLKRYKARLVDAWRHGPVTTGLEEEERIRRLKALGYL